MPSQAGWLWMAVTPVVVLCAAGLAAAQERSAQDVRLAIEDLISHSRDVSPLMVTYDDLHPLHGGLVLTIHGDGRVEQRGVRTKLGKARHVPPDDVAKLVQALGQTRAWRQEVAERPAVPDESRASLTIAYGPSSSRIWEWFGDLQQLQRIGYVRDVMTAIAWER